MAHLDLFLLAIAGSEYCGNPERHEYELYLAIEISIIDAPRCTVQSTSCRPTWICGSASTMNKGRMRTLVLRQNANADLPGRDPDGEGEDDRSLNAIGHQNPIAQPPPPVRSSFG